MRIKHLTAGPLGDFCGLKVSFGKLDDLSRFLSVNQNLGLYKMRMPFSQDDS